MKKYYEINGYTFEEITTPKAVESLLNNCKRWWNSCDDIYEAYKNPSIYKVNAFNNWKNFVRKIKGNDFFITAHGMQTFSLTFEFAHPETGELCKAWITKDNNRFAKVQ